MNQNPKYSKDNQYNRYDQSPPCHRDGDKYIVLLSGGLDSTVNLYALHQENPKAITMAMTFDYGQKAASREIDRSKQMCTQLNVPHRVIPLPFIRDFGSESSLIQSSPHTLPQGQEIQIEDLKTSQQTAQRVWVPNRNGIFVNIAAGYAEAAAAKAGPGTRVWILPGFNCEEARTFPDNSEEFLEALNKSLEYSTSQEYKVRVRSLTSQMDKKQIVRWGNQLGIDWEKTIWPCYQGGEDWCHECESCQRTLQALSAESGGSGRPGVLG